VATADTSSVGTSAKCWLFFCSCCSCCRAQCCGLTSIGQRRWPRWTSIGSCRRDWRRWY